MGWRRAHVVKVQPPGQKPTAVSYKEHAAVYINTDGNDRGYLAMEGSHSLEHFMNEVARDVEDPESKLSVFERERLAEIVQAKKDEERKELRQRPDLRMGAPVPAPILYGLCRPSRHCVPRSRLPR